MNDRNESLSEQLYKSLRQAIILGEWRVGKRINEKELSEQRHVSRTPIRYALKRIYEEGLLDYNKNTGYSVRAVTLEDVVEIYEIREALECLATHQAAQRMTREQDEWLESLIIAGEQAIEQQQYDVLVASSTRFNDAIFEIAQMPRLEKIQHDLQEYLIRFRSLSLLGKYNSRRIHAVSEHKAILSAMRLKDDLLIREMISEHLEQSKQYVIGLLPYFDGHQESE